MGSEPGGSTGRRSPGRTLARILRSRALAVAAMIAMFGILALAGFAPDLETRDPARLAELESKRPILLWLVRTLRPGEIAANPLFLILPAYLFCGILLSVTERIRQFRRQAGRASAGRFRVERDAEKRTPGAWVPDQLARFAKGEGFEVYDVKPNRIETGLGRAGFVGSIAFHVGLLLVFAGVVVSSRTRFGGEIVLTEGFLAPLGAASIQPLSGSRNVPDFPGISVAIRSFVAEYSATETPVDFSAVFQVVRDGTPIAEGTTRVNQAFHWKDLQFTLHRYGFAPEVSLQGSGPEPTVEGVAVLQVIPPGKPDFLELPDGGRLRLRFFPDFADDRGRPTSRSLRPLHPVLLVDRLSRSGGAIASARVGLGESAAIGAETIAFPAFSYWGAFVVARDRGLWLFVVGSLLGSAGICLRLLFPDRTLRIELLPGENPPRARVVATTRFFPAIHEDAVDKLVRRLEEVP